MPKNKQQQKNPIELKIVLQFYSQANSTHGNVVRVAPRQKNTPQTTSSVAAATSTSTIISSPSVSYCYNLAHSFPSTNSNNTSTMSNLSTYPIFLQINDQNNGNMVPTSPMITSNHKPIDCTDIIENGSSIKSTAITTAAQNPFLAKRSKPLNHLRYDRHFRPPPPPPPSQQTQEILTALSIPNARSLAMHCTMDKKFNSLKSISARKTPQFYSLRLNKCKRHQSLANPTYDIQQKLLVINNTTLPYSSKQLNQKNASTIQGQAHHSDSEHEPHSLSPAIRKPIRFNQQQQPLYENLLNSALEHNKNGSIAISTNFDEFYCDANDANSIYRSDSGISNSSYELTPRPAPRNNPRNCQSAPVYVNLPKYTTFHSGNRINSTSNKKIGCVSTATTAFNYEVCFHFLFSVF